MDEHAWIDSGPLAGGTFMVVRRMQMLHASWKCRFCLPGVKKGDFLGEMLLLNVVAFLIIICGLEAQGAMPKLIRMCYLCRAGM